MVLKFNFLGALTAFGIISTIAANPVFADTTIDLYNSFPAYQGDNGFSAYGFNPATSTYQLLSNPNPYYFDRVGDQWGNPNIWGSTYSSNFFGGPLIFFNPAGTASLTGIPEDAVLGYVAPTSANDKLIGSFSLAAAAGYDVLAYIKNNNTIIWSSYVAPGTTQNFDLASFTVKAGDTIYYGVGALNQYSFSELNSWSGLQGQINSSPVPVPGAIWLFGSALAGFIGFNRRKTIQQ